MSQSFEPTPNLHRILCGRATADHLKRLLPSATYREATKYLIRCFEAGAGDHANCGNTELSIKLDRLEEVLSLLALTNLDVADLYRRQIGGELLRTGSVAAQVAASLPSSTPSKR